jgi:hypothetical protein
MKGAQMNTARLLAVAFVALGSLALRPQQPTQGAQAAQSGYASNAVQLEPVKAELLSRLDTRTAKTGDSVVVKTKDKVRTADGTIIPKGSRLVGHVTEVEAHATADENSKVVLDFDQAELKGGQKLPIRSVIQSVWPASGYATADTSDSYSASMPSAPMSSSPASGGGMSGRSASSASPSSSPGTSSSMDTGSVMPQPTKGAAKQLPPVGTVVAKDGDVDVRTTAIPGVLLANNANGKPFSNASGALLGTRQDIHLDSGTRLVLGLVVAGSATSQ